MPSLNTQTIVSSGPQSVFNLPAGVNTSAGILKVRVNGTVAAFSWTGASQITLKAPTPARAIVDFDIETDVNKASISSEASLDFPSIAAQSASELTISNVKGALVGDVVALGLPANVPLGLVYQAYVSAADTVKVRATNVTAGAIDASAGTFRVNVVKA